MRLTLLLLPFCYVSCFNPNLGDTPYTCAPIGKACPNGYECKAGYCVLEGTSEDLGVQKDLPDLGPPSKETGVYLDGALVQSSAACSDNSSEPNNSATTATKLASQGLIPDWEICYPGDVDHYKITINAGQTLKVEIRFTHANGDLDAALLNPNGYIIRESRSEDDNESFEVTAPEDGPNPAEYIVGVFGFGDATNEYNLYITISD